MPHAKHDGRQPRSRNDVEEPEALLLTPEEAARLLRVGRTTVYALIKAGALRPVHIGRSCRLSRGELERFVGRLETPSPAVARRPRRQGRATTNQRSLFELTSHPNDPA